MTDRAEIVARVAGSLRLEGLAPSERARELAAAWVAGQASAADLREADRRILAGEPIADLFAPAPTGAPRAA